MNSIDRMLIEHECMKLAIAYCYHADDYNHDAMVQLFAPDTLWESAKGPLRGHAEIKKYLESKARTSVGMHHLCNTVIDVIDENHATGVSFFTFYTGPLPEGASPSPFAGPTSAGRYHDRFVKTADGWRFDSRRVEFTFRVPAKG